MSAKRKTPALRAVACEVLNLAAPPASASTVRRMDGGDWPRDAQKWHPKVAGCDHKKKERVPTTENSGSTRDARGTHEAACMGRPFPRKAYTAPT
jgi:hypothetical protein